ncbi:O-antigen ligase family protein [Arthrobacter sp. NQ4]|uniref:O-antigen ligase family protein n=1 Tax=Arthrobacter sp. NQ4 TaxID=3027930 RepID=UPI0023AF593A|nr:O-antigen ligase family protein [Arthrobacter sp. NQ4]MDE8585923.1 hypothetical protein [Arthrobacter sp. NQ4]
MTDLSAAFAFAASVVVAVFFVSSNVRLAFLVICATFVTRPSVSLAGFSIRLELIVGLLCLMRIIHESLSKRRTTISPAVKWSMSCIAGWLLFAGITSLNVPPMPQKSISVLMWCALNVITAIWIARTPGIWYTLIRVGSVAALIVSILAIVFWVAASSFLFNYGVQSDPAYGGFAAYGFSIEANILGGLLCLWALVAVYNPLNAVPNRVRILLAAIVPVAILATHTRAALVSYVIGLVGCLLFRARARRVAAGSAVLGGIAAAYLLLTGSDRGLDKFFNVFDISGGTGGLRYRVNNIALEEWWSSSNRIIGLGWNSFGQRHIDDTQPHLLLPGYIGNLPVQIAYDGGLIGVALVVLAATVVVTQVIRQRRADLLCIFAIPYFAFSIATSALWLLETWVFVGLAWGLCSSAGKTAVSKAILSARSFRPVARGDIVARQVL